MDHAEFNSTMVPTSTPSQGLGSTPNPVLPLIQDYPTLLRQTQQINVKDMIQMMRSTLLLFSNLQKIFQNF